MSLNGISDYRPNVPDVERKLLADIYRTQAQTGNAIGWAVATLFFVAVLWRLAQ